MVARKETLKEKLFFGEYSGGPAITDDGGYVMVHQKGTESKEFARLSFEDLEMYVEGATAFKTPSQLEIINGIPKDKEVHQKYDDIKELYRLEELLEKTETKEFLK